MVHSNVSTVVIEPRKGLFSLGVRELWEYRELLFFLAWRDMKTRYAQAVIGIGWTILQPILTMLVFTVIFSLWAKFPSDGLPYPLFIYAALVPWTFFAKCLDRSSGSVVAEAALVSKVYFPRLILPLAATLGGLLDFAIGLIILFGLMLWYGLLPNWEVVFLPVFVLMEVATSIGISLWLSALNVRYRDVSAVVPLITQLWMFASPIVYPTTMVPEKWHFLYSLNPMVGVIEGFRWALFGQINPNINAMIISSVIILCILYGGVIYFRNMEQTFADEI